jgi:hypothetical protein
MNRAATTRSPDEIERQVYQTQDRIAETFDELMDRLHPMDLLRSLFGSGSQSGAQAWDQARRNPLALAMIVGGTAWLFSSHDARPSAFTHGKSQGNGADHSGTFDAGAGYYDPHSAYVTHMASIEQRENEAYADYQRRRDTARGTYLMLERGHDEDDVGFRSRLDRATEDLRSRTSAFGQKLKDMAQGASSGASNAGSSVANAGRSAADRTQELFLDNPLVSGLLAAAAGAAAGAAMPMTETEHENLGELGEAARQTAKEQASEAAENANEMIAPDGGGDGLARTSSSPGDRPTPQPNRIAS